MFSRGTVAYSNLQAKELCDDDVVTLMRNIHSPALTSDPSLRDGDLTAVPVLVQVIVVVVAACFCKRHRNGKQRGMSKLGRNRTNT